MISIPYLLTFSTGVLTLHIIVKNHTPLSGILFASLSALIGISITIVITFCSFVIFNHFHFPFILFMHILLIGLLCFKSKPFPSSFNKKPDSHSLITGLLILCSSLLSWLYVKIFPLGGWDAWQVWNFKSTFLLFGGDRWKELFDPLLWRSSPHYPLGLPLFNAWTWAFTKESAVFAPLANAILFNVLMMGLMIGLLRRHCSSKLIYLPVIILFLSPTYMFLMTNQYCDILVSLFLLAAFGMVLETNQSWGNRSCILAGIFLGSLSFLKLEGTVLSALIFLSAHGAILNKSHKIKPLFSFWLSTLAFGLPTLLFLFFLSPGNQSFINGWMSPEHPSTLLRLQTILIGLFRETSSTHWRFLWGIILLAGLLYEKNIFRRDLFIFPITMLIYLCVIIAQYWTNTYFDITWWLNVSLGRILSVLLPSIIIWLTIGILPKKSSGD